MGDFEDIIDGVIDDSTEKLFSDASKTGAYMVQQAIKSALQQDECGALNTIDHPHHEIHEGCYWFADDQSASLASGAVKYWLFVTPNEDNFFHSFPQLYGTGEFEIQSYENPTVATNGTEIPLLNRNRPLGGTTTHKFYKDPTGVNLTGAVKVRDIRVGAGKAIGESRSENELILKKNTKYLIVCTSRVANCIISVHMNGYICGIGG